jgi:hypothetical protein
VGQREGHGLTEQTGSGKRIHRLDEAVLALIPAEADPAGVDERTGHQGP